jgi:hypothetical protein
MRTNETIWCDGCGVEILCLPIITPLGEFCCKDCSLGLPCSCGELLELEDYPTSLSTLQDIASPS